MQLLFPRKPAVGGDWPNPTRHSPSSRSVTACHCALDGDDACVSCCHAVPLQVLHFWRRYTMSCRTKTYSWHCATQVTSWPHCIYVWCQPQLPGSPAHLEGCDTCSSDAAQRRPEPTPLQASYYPFSCCGMCACARMRSVQVLLDAQPRHMADYSHWVRCQN